VREDELAKDLYLMDLGAARGHARCVRLDAGGAPGQG